MKKMRKILGLLTCMLIFSCSTQNEDVNSLSNEDTIAFSETYNYKGELVTVNYNENNDYFEDNLSDEVINALEKGVFSNGNKGERDWYLFDNIEELNDWRENTNSKRSAKNNNVSFHLLVRRGQIYSTSVPYNKFIYVPAYARSRGTSYAWSFNVGDKIKMDYGNNSERRKYQFDNQDVTGPIKINYDYVWRIKHRN